MANTALYTRWGQPFPGREQMGLGIFMEAIQFYQKLQGQKEIESFSVFLMENGGLFEQQGTVVVEGSREQIQKLQQREDFQRILLKATHVVNDLVVTTAYTGEAVMQRIELLQSVRKELGIS